MILIYTYIIYMIIVAVGITAGYHRYFSHREFTASPALETVMLYCGLLCGGQSALTWAGVHRMHHAYADTERDPHSPKFNPWWSILFSTWRVESIPRKFIKDLLRNKRVIFFHKYGRYIYFAHYPVLYIIFGWQGVFVLFGITILSFLGYGMLNLFGHNANGPVNRLWVNIIAPFEGKHEDHHANSKNRRN